MTVDELEAMLDDGWAYELVSETLGRMPMSSGGASRIGYRLGKRPSN
jgi:Uma2 family endonuclease